MKELCMVNNKYKLIDINNENKENTQSVAVKRTKPLNIKEYYFLVI